jgi:hypothetical protein
MQSPGKGQLEEIEEGGDSFHTDSDFNEFSEKN